MIVWITTPLESWACALNRNVLKVSVWIPQPDQRWTHVNYNNRESNTIQLYSRSMRNTSEENQMALQQRKNNHVGHNDRRNLINRKAIFQFIRTVIILRPLWLINSSQTTILLLQLKTANLLLRIIKKKMWLTGLFSFVKVSILFNFRGDVRWPM